MRVVVQRVSQASVSVNGHSVGAIGRGLLILLGVETTDTDAEMEWIAAKSVALRIFPDETGVMNRSVIDIDGDILVVSQFTLTASTRKGNRPAYIRAAGREVAVPFYERFCRRVSEFLGKDVATGVFGADMQVSLVNDGPVTIIIDSKLRE